MTKIARPKLSQPKDEVIQSALRAASWPTAESLLRSLYMIGRSKYTSDRELLDSAKERAANLHDYMTLLGGGASAEVFIDCAIRGAEEFQPFREQALALVGRMGRYQPLQSGEAA